MNPHARISLLIVGALLLSGCAAFNDHASTVLHNLKPHRLWRLNRHPAPRRDVYYSVPDPIPALNQQFEHAASGRELPSAAVDVDAPPLP